jgi:NAD(P)-dependent dehydrogenase (short-subunit alcohol dehydrogenase family)
VVVVTGASAGIGRATAREFGKRGDAVALLARDRGRLEVAKREIEDAGGRAMVCPVDVADADAVEAAAAAVEDTFGPIDVWVNVAMAAVLAPVSQTTAAEFRRVTEVTYLGYVHGTLAALARMSQRDRGVIVQVSSGLAQRAIPLQATYCAAKHAIRGFTRALRCELLHDGSGVKVAMVDLPGVNTPQFGWVKTTLRRHPRPVAPVYQPEVAARAIAWTADHPRAELYVGAITPAMIWADRLAPGLVDRYLARTNIDAQQMPDRPIDPDRPSYLWEPIPGDVGAHGIFDDEAKDSSAQLWFTTHRRPALAAAAVASTVLACLRPSRTRNHTKSPG